MVLETGRCYQCGGRPEKALQSFQELMGYAGEGPLIHQAVYGTAYSWFLMREYEAALSVLRGDFPGSKTPSMTTLEAICTMHLGDWHGAYKILNGAAPPNPAHPVDPDLEGLRDLAETGFRSRRKSPFLAGFLSAFVPGLGKVYAAGYADGLFSAASIGLLADSEAYLPRCGYE